MTVSRPVLLVRLPPDAAGADGSIGLSLAAAGDVDKSSPLSVVRPCMYLGETAAK